MPIDCMEKGNSVRQDAFAVKAGLRHRKVVPHIAKAETRFATRVCKVLAVIFLVLILFVWTATGRREKPQSPNAPQYPPAILIDEVEHLPPLAWKAIPLSLPNPGIVNFEVQVVQGNPIDVFLTKSDQIDGVKKVEWGGLKVYGDVSTTRTKTFRRAVRLAQGRFYLVLRDMTVATPSSPDSDVSVKVQLNP
jgi:hypothetical protein